ncbi:MAG TPA: glycosyltransferase family 2 protein [Stellaceae bacterium]|nr:glycosyltransferase family 2 protein [Stellaceae bacterium]
MGWPWTVETPRLPARLPDGSAWPRITIVTPSRNQGAFIEEAIRSVLLQGYPDLEYIVSDGGSADGTVDIIKKYAPWLAGWVSERDRGQSHAINKGFAASTGMLLGWLNSDDALLPGALSSVASLDLDFRDPLLIAGRSEYRNETGRARIWAVDAVPESRAQTFRYFSGLYFAQPSVLFTRSALGASGALDEALHYAMDLDLWLRMTKLARIVTVERRLSWMRRHDDAKTWRDPLPVFDEVERVLRAHVSDDVRGIVEEELEAARARRAAAWIDAGRGSLRDGSRAGALAAAVQAVRAELSAAFSRRWLGLVLRALAPARFT